MIDRPILSFVVHGPPVPKARARVFQRPGEKARAVTPAKTMAYEKHVGTIARGALSHLRGWRTDWAAYALTVRAFRSTRRGDLDNVIKVVGDSLIGVAYADDSAIMRISAEMADDPERPRIEVAVEML